MSGDLVREPRGRGGAGVELGEQSSPGDRWIGRTLADTYRITSILGEGGMGSVYRARHTRLPAEFAVKVLAADLLKTGEAVARFMREAEISVTLRHPHIVEVFDFNKTADGDLYIVMELLEGETLYDRIARKGKLKLTETVAITKQIAAALGAAHRKKVIHRDLKPSNIFLVKHDDDDDWVKVVDFGISKLVGSRNTLTGEKRILGTPWYMSPEQVRGQSDRMDGRADVFALGAIVYEMLCGHQAFASDSVATALYKVAHEAPPPMSDRSGAVPPAVEVALMRALAKEIEQRTPTVEQFAKELERAVVQSRTMPDLAPLDDRVVKAALTAAGIPAGAPSGVAVDITGPQLPASRSAQASGEAEDAGSAAPAKAPQKTGRGFAPHEAEMIDAPRGRGRSPVLPIAIIVLGVGMGALAATLLLRERKPASGSAANAATNAAATVNTASKGAGSASASASSGTAAASAPSAGSAAAAAAGTSSGSPGTAAGGAAAASASAGSASARGASASAGNGASRPTGPAARRVAAARRAARRRALARQRARRRAAQRAAAKRAAAEAAKKHAAEVAKRAAVEAAKQRAAEAARRAAAKRAAAKKRAGSKKKGRKDWVKTADELFK